MTDFLLSDSRQTISPIKADRLFWLGRYAERVYISLHFLRKHFDMMIDEDDNAYQIYCAKMGIENKYSSANNFYQSYLLDANNPDSVISMLLLAKDNAMVLREDLTTETISYIEMSITQIVKCKEDKLDFIELQHITDYVLAFWGSIDVRVFNIQVRHIIKFGKFVEALELHLRFQYPTRKVQGLFDLLYETVEKDCYICNLETLQELEQVLNHKTIAYEQALNTVNQLYSI